MVTGLVSNKTITDSGQQDNIDGECYCAYKKNTKARNLRKKKIKLG